MKCEKKEARYESKKKKDSIICYECKKLGHVKYNCPRLKKKRSNQKKTLMATWSDGDSTQDDEVANLCLMAIQEDGVASNSPPSISYTFDELKDAYDDLFLVFKALFKKTII
ncbi:hypothetical protein GQ457_13G016850 [Hibiscus cannabinus]